MVEQGDTIMAELVGRVSMAEAFVLRDGLICERRAWVVPLEEDDVR